MIKKIHLIWLGKQIPTQYAARVTKWGTLNPDYKVYLWILSGTLSPQAMVGTAQLASKNVKVYDCAGKKMLVGMEDCFAHEVVTSTPNYGAASDILRVQILLAKGGFYFDTDIEPVKPLGSISASKGYLVNSVHGTYTNDILYAKSTKHAFFLKYRKHMLEQYAKLFKNHPLMQQRRTDAQTKNQTTQDMTGPGALCDALEYNGMGTDDSLVFPKDRVSQTGSDSSWL